MTKSKLFCHNLYKRYKHCQRWTWGSTQYHHNQAQHHCIHKHKQKGMKKPQFVSLSSLWMTSPLTIRELCGLIWFFHPILDGFYQLRPPRFYLLQQKNLHLHLRCRFHQLHLILSLLVLSYLTLFTPHHRYGRSFFGHPSKMLTPACG